jgi:hypothetical protein
VQQAGSDSPLQARNPVWAGMRRTLHRLPKRADCIVVPTDQALHVANPFEECAGLQLGLAVLRAPERFVVVAERLRIREQRLGSIGRAN